MAEDELKLRRQAERGARAKALADDPTVIEAFGLIEKDAVRIWQESGPNDAPLRERCHVVMTVLGAFKENLAQMISDGKVANTILAQPKHPNRSKVA